jgi:NAD(P)-dependent dehydrogenase (short-subunit alcohol dehydrogenase family)
MRAGRTRGHRRGGGEPRGKDLPGHRRQLAKEILAGVPAIHVLVNNAAVVNLRRTTTADGLETTFAVNHLAYFLLTNLLRERIVASAPARIVNVASDGHKFGRLDFDDLQLERRYSWWRAYTASSCQHADPWRPSHSRRDLPRPRPRFA